MKSILSIVFIIILVLFGFSCIYTVDETEQVVITKFGKPIGDPITEPGFHTKWPWYSANYFPKNLLEWDGDPNQIQTLEKKFIWVDTFARWKIVDPLKYFETVNIESVAQSRLDDILNSKVRNNITSNSMIETVRNTDRKMEVDSFGNDTNTLNKDDVINAPVVKGRAKIAKKILDDAQPQLLELGIELVDVKIKRINYEDEVQNSVFKRMIAERKQIAEKFRSEGQGEARKIEGEREKEMKRITSEAYKAAEEIKGNAEAEAMLIYARAYEKDPEFYSFWRTLNIYKQSIGKDSSLILSTDSEFLKYFKGYKGKN